MINNIHESVKMELAFARIICLAISRLAEIKCITISFVVKLNLGREPNENSWHMRMMNFVKKGFFTYTMYNRKGQMKKKIAYA